MSAMHATIQADRVTIMADAAFYNPDGTLVGLEGKLVPVPGIPAVFSSRGIFYAFELFEQACNDVPALEWDDFATTMEERGARWDQLTKERAKSFTSQVMIAGWSESRNRGEVLFRSQHDQYGLEAGLTYVWLDGHVSFGIDGDELGDPERFTIPEGIAAFETARCTPWDLACGRANVPIWGHSIGGWIDAATVGPDGVTTFQRVHEWADTVGQKITPARVLAQAAA